MTRAIEIVRSRAEQSIDILQGGRAMNPTWMILHYFRFDHLPARLQAASAPFCELAKTIANGPTNGPETTTALRKLLESKDCYVRAVLEEQSTQQQIR